MTLRIKDTNTNETFLIDSLKGKPTDKIIGDVVDLEIDKKKLIKSNCDINVVAHQAKLRVDSFPNIKYVIIGHRYLCRVNACKLYNVKLTFGIKNEVTNIIEERDILLNEIVDLDTANELDLIYEKPEEEAKNDSSDSN